MRYYFDTEFHENGRTIQPISFGMVAEDGRELYMEFKCDHLPVNDFVKEHVIPNLTWDHSDRLMAYGLSAREQLIDFVGADMPEFWAYFADYDWVVLCQMFGRMVDLPSHFPMFCRDVQQVYVEMEDRTGLKPDKPKDAHNALADAKWTKEFHERLMSPYSHRKK